MLMIVFCHFAACDGFNFPTSPITVNKLWYQLILMGGSLGNNIFVLISGYFLVKSQGFEFKRLLNLWIRIFFYSVLFFYLFIFLGLENFSLKEALHSFMPVIQMKWGFASVYFVLYLIHPYLNILLKNLNREEYKKFLILIFTLRCIIPTFTNYTFGRHIDLINFICLYCLAGYFQLWAKDIGNKKFIFYGFCCIALNFLSVIIFDFMGLEHGKALYFYGMTRPFTILGTLCLLLGFKSLNIKHNKLINLTAAATFGVYLIHVDRFAGPFLWEKFFRTASFQDSPYLIPYSIGVVILVFTVCTLIEIVRSKIFRLISHGRLS